MASSADGMTRRQTFHDWTSGWNSACTKLGVRTRRHTAAAISSSLAALLALFALCCAPRGSAARPAERRENVQIMESRDGARQPGPERPEKPSKIKRAHALRMRERPTPLCARFNLHRPNILRRNDLLRVLFSWRLACTFPPRFLLRRRRSLLFSCGMQAGPSRGERHGAFPVTHAVGGRFVHARIINDGVGTQFPCCA